MSKPMIPHEIRKKDMNGQELKTLEPKYNPNLLRKRKWILGDTNTVIPVETKRNKLDQNSENSVIKDVLESLSSAINREERLSAILAACSTFNHDLSSIHDHEIQKYKADAILCKHLSFLLQRAQLNPSRKQCGKEEMEKLKYGLNQTGKLSQYLQSGIEIGHTCKALEMVCRASPQVLSKSFENFGSELLDTLIAVINRKEAYTAFQKDTTINQSGKPIEIEIRKSIGIFCHLASVGSAVERIAHHPGVLKGLIDIIVRNTEHGIHNTIIEEDTCSNCLWILGNLACTPKNMALIINYPGLIKALLNVMKAYNKSYYKLLNWVPAMKKFVAAGQAIRIIRNLSCTVENKIKVSGHPEVIDQIARFVYLPSQLSNYDRKVNSLITKTKCHVIVTMQNIAATPLPIIKLHLCQKRDQSFISALLHVITNKLSGENTIEDCKEDLAMKESAMAALCSLIHKETINSIFLHEGLGNAIQNVSAGFGNEKGNIPKLIQTIVTRIRLSVGPDMKCFQLATKFLVGKLETINPLRPTSNNIP